MLVFEYDAKQQAVEVHADTEGIDQLIADRRDAKSRMDPKSWRP